MFSIIAAIGKNGEIGKKNKLLWNIPEDLKNFRKITKGRTVVMGRKTFESIGRPLPDRKNIVISRTLKKEDMKNGELEVYDDFEKLTGDFQNSEEEIFIIGGEEIYRQALSYVDKLYISHVEYSDREADAHFPEINYNEWRKIIEERQFDNWKFCIYEKI